MSSWGGMTEDNTALREQCPECKRLMTETQQHFGFCSARCRAEAENRKLMTGNRLEREINKLMKQYREGGIRE